VEELDRDFTKKEVKVIIGMKNQPRFGKCFTP
jgi:hypothetical protein